MCGEKILMMVLHISGTRLDESVFHDQLHTQYLGQTIPHMRQTNEQVTLWTVLFQCWADISKVSISDKFCSLAVSAHCIPCDYVIGYTVT